MSDDISGRGDPRKTLELLWGRAPRSSRGPKARLTVADVVAAAIALVDAEGLAALTTRRVAEDLGVSPMSLYTYVPGKPELIDLMLDALMGEIRAPTGTTWRERVADVARQNWALVLRHPWMVEVVTHRPVLGPNSIAKYHLELSALEGIGLDDLEMDRALTLVLDYVAGAVRGAARERTVKERTGMTDREWWAQVGPFLAEVFDTERFPLAARVGQVAGETYGAHDPAGAFAFGLERVLDGLELLVTRKSRRPAS
ncbi:TetR/AcrR family transcriptional regulator [Nannocystis pusilla]|uniref:TetR/AcrR family transcriptional regulator n=1 Tax=Nannocystis pusilla TaxID=889268 RepID=UPI003DA23D32